MQKKLPAVFINKLASKIDNNKDTYYSKGCDNIMDTYEKKEHIDALIVRKKISDIFASSNFIYKVRVIITDKNGRRGETVVAKNSDSLITIQNEKIKIDEILDIEIVSNY